MTGWQQTKLKPRWDVHLSGDDDQLGCAGESLSSVLGEQPGSIICPTTICAFHLRSKPHWPTWESRCCRPAPPSASPTPTQSTMGTRWSMAATRRPVKRSSRLSVNWRANLQTQICYHSLTIRKGNVHRHGPPPKPEGSRNPRAAPQYPEVLCQQGQNPPLPKRRRTAPL